MNLSDALNHPVFGVIKSIANDSGIKIFVIGGFVRDYLMGNFSNDIDIVVLGSGIDVARMVAQRLNIEEVVVYENYGTALINYESLKIEFVGARKESYKRNSRKPIVETGTLEDDQLRRDFTINALSISLNSEDFGMMYDPFNGLNDINQRIIRTPTDPTITFSDDPLRMMRAIRFATRFNFFIEEHTFKTIEEQRNRIEIISIERISEELNKIIMCKKPSVGFVMLLKTKLIEIIFPELYRMLGVETKNGIGHKDNFFHTLKVLDNVAEKSDNLWLRWSAILHDIGKPLTKRFDPENGWTFQGHEEKGGRMVKGIFQRLRLPLNEKMKYVQKLVRIHQRPIVLADKEVSDSAIRRLVVDAGEDLDDLLTLCRCDITTGDSVKMERYLNNYDNLALRIKDVESRDSLRNWQPPITGEIIMETFGLNPGPVIGIIKNAVREAILEGEIPNDFQQAYDLMIKIGSQQNLKLKRP